LACEESGGGWREKEKERECVSVASS
jgi:hypothetical protein